MRGVGIISYYSFGLLSPVAISVREAVPRTKLSLVEMFFAN
jgi:hypothetical protein